MEAARRSLEVERPYLVVGSPSDIRASSKENLEKKTKYLHELTEMYVQQHRQGKLFVHEAPADAASWHSKCIRELALLQGDMAVVERGPTAWLTNSPAIAAELAAGRTAPVLAEAVATGLRSELIRVGLLDALGAGGPTVEEADPTEAWWGQFKDEVTGASLPPQAVHEARSLEVEYMHKLKVYVGSTAEEMKADGCRAIPTRWLDVNKGDASRIEIRSRLVAQETQWRSDIAAGDVAATFAATPPLEGIRLLVSLAVSGQSHLQPSAQRVLGFYDISRAHFHSPVRRRLYVVPPPEDTSIDTGVARLCKAMYGTRDAAQCFDAFAESAMRALGFEIGVFSPCLYWHKEKNASCARHGDDFVLLATRAVHKWFFEEMNKHMITKHTGTLGGQKELGDVQEIKCLNRLIRYVRPPFKSAGSAYMEWEPDPRHAEILFAALGLNTESKAVVTPGVKEPATADSTPLDADGREKYRSNTMRYAYLALDRPDLQFSAKELARNMQAPTQFDLEQLKRAGRYLLGRRRVVQRFEAQEMPTAVTVYSDSDHAGCLKTRRSTSCCMVFFGKHMIRSSVTTQAVVALSSGESEFYASVKAASIGLGAAHMILDIGIVLESPVDLRMDATAGIGIASRRGAGRIRHIHTPALWLQRAVADRRVAMGKVAGTANPADLGTKHVDRNVITHAMATCGFVTLQGESNLALRAQLATA
jgi:hypothetical protein